MPAKNTPEEQHLALTVYASQAGRKDLVAPMLKELGLDIPVKRVRDWAYRLHKDEYEQIKQEVEAYTRSQHVDTFRAVADIATDVASEAMRQLLDLLQRGEIDKRDLPKVAKDSMVAAAVATDKAELLSGNPTQRVSHDVGDLQRELASVGVTIVLPGQVDAGKPPAIDVRAKEPALPAGTE